MITVAFLIIAIICFICGIYFFYKGKNISIQKTEQQNKILENINKLTEQKNNLSNIIKEKQERESQLESSIKKKYNEKAQLVNEIQQQQGKIQSYYEVHKKEVDDQLIIYQQNIDNQKKKDQIDYEAGRQQLEVSLAQVRAQLDKLKATRKAIQDSFLREEKIKEEKDFYTLHLTDKALHDIKILRAIENDLIDPRPLKMAIWTSCYSKNVNKLCDRIFGTAKKSGIYKITYLPTQQCYIGQARDLKERIREHCKAGFARIDTPANNKLYEKMNEGNISDFTFELLQECPSDQLNEKEKYYIDLYSAYNFGMNSNKGIGNGI